MGYYRALDEVNKAPLAERKEAAKEFFEAMRDPEIVAERVGWLLDGNYGEEEMRTARRMLNMRANANKAASLTQMVGVLEWNCPPDTTRKNWHKLTATQQAALTRAVNAAMRE